MSSTLEKRALTLGLALVASSVLAVPARAQIDSLDPTPIGGAEEPPPSRPPAEAPDRGANIPIVIGPDGKIIDQGGGDEPLSGVHYDEYLSDEDFGFDDEGNYVAVAPQTGPIPETHVVRKGDTLWDISRVYFGNPYEWPKVWSKNPEITNPHWIYPGDLVRLRDGSEGGDGEGEGVEPVGNLDDPEGGGDAPVTTRPQNTSFRLRDMAFLEEKQINASAVIDGSPSERLMLAQGDDAYLRYGKKPLKLGETYAIYSKRKEVKHPEKGHVVGAYVEVVGHLTLRSAIDGKRARGTIVDSVDVIERGMLVRKIKTDFGKVKPTPADRDLQGTIVGQLEADELIGERQVVIIDRGKKHGVRRGNRMFIIRRGDAYERVMSPGNNVGQDDKRFPARAIGELIVAQVGTKSSLAVVSLSTQEIGIGDHVLMRSK